MGVYNIASHEHGRWCAADRNATQHVPVIIMEQFFQNSSALDASKEYFADFAKKVAGKGSPYDNLYMAVPTGVSYILPYLEEYHHEVRSEWSAGRGPSYSNNIGIEARLLLEQFQSQAAGIEQPHVWSGQHLASYVVRFPLINTYKPDEDIEKHYTFLYNLLGSNMLGRPNAIHYLPPALYTVEIPGVRYSPAAVISNVTVKNAGALHFHKTTGGLYNVPDAFIVELTIKELILESREILDTVFAGAAKSTVTAGLVS